MALQNPSQTTSYDQSATYILSLDNVIDIIALDDHPLIAKIGIDRGNPAIQTKHEWDEDELNPVTVTAGRILESAVSATGSALVLSSTTDAARVTAGTLLRDQLSGKNEVLQVTAVSGKSATVTRGYGSTSAEAHGASAVYDIIANPRPQGMEGPKDESVVRSRSYNYTQIFSKGVQITGTANAIKHNGIPQGGEDSYQIDKRTRELMRELDRTLIMGIRAANNVADGTYGTMGGLIDYIKHATSGNTNSTVETLTPSVLNDMLQQIFDDGGTPDLIIVGGVQKRKISAFDKEYRRSTMDVNRAGFTVDEFVSDLGVNLQVIVDRWMPSDMVIVVDSSRVSIRPLQGRDFFLEKLAKTGDSDKWQIVGEYTVEVKAAAKAHAIHWNLKQ